MRFRSSCGSVRVFLAGSVVRGFGWRHGYAPSKCREEIYEIRCRHRLAGCRATHTPRRTSRFETRIRHQKSARGIHILNEVARSRPNRGEILRVSRVGNCACTDILTGWVVRAGPQESVTSGETELCRHCPEWERLYGFVREYRVLWNWRRMHSREE